LGGCWKRLIRKDCQCSGVCHKLSEHQTMAAVSHKDTSQDPRDDECGKKTRQP
jgi:hypothetical protein